jgi:hypothetical protein
MAMPDGRGQGAGADPSAQNQQPQPQKQNGKNPRREEEWPEAQGKRREPSRGHLLLHAFDGIRSHKVGCKFLHQYLENKKGRVHPALSE